MPLGDDVVRLIQRVAAGEAISPQELDTVRLKLNTADAMLGLFRHINPASGEIMSLRAAQVELDSSGLRLIDSTPDDMDEAATVKWLDADTKLPLGTIGSYRNAAKTTATLDIYANSGHQIGGSFTNATLELAAISKGDTDNWATWLFLDASGDVAGDDTVVELNIGKAAAWKIPLEIIHNFTSRETLFVFDCRKTTTGDPSGQEGMLYYNTVDNVIKMYADGAWRQLAAW